MLTDEQTQLAAYPIVLRRYDERDKELWFAVSPEALPEAYRLWQRGYLDRRWHGDDLVYRASDRAMTAHGLHATMADRAADRN